MAVIMRQRLAPSSKLRMCYSIMYTLQKENGSLIRVDCKLESLIDLYSFIVHRFNWLNTQLR